MNDAVAPKFDLTPPSKDELRGLIADLSEEEQHVLLEHGTEAPFCGVFLDEKRQGVYTCRLCGLPLFKAGTKFESGTGWPSFTNPSRKTISDQFATRATAWSAPRSSAPVAARIRGMSFPTARRRPASATASIRSRSSSRRTASRSPTSSAVAPQRARHWAGHEKRKG